MDSNSGTVAPQSRHETGPCFDTKAAPLGATLAGAVARTGTARSFATRGFRSIGFRGFFQPGRGGRQSRHEDEARSA